MFVHGSLVEELTISPEGNATTVAGPRGAALRLPYDSVVRGRVSVTLRFKRGFVLRKPVVIVSDVLRVGALVVAEPPQQRQLVLELVLDVAGDKAGLLNVRAVTTLSVMLNLTVGLYPAC